MANLFEHKDRRVVPNWRSFGRTTILGELNSFQKERFEQIEEPSIEGYVIDYEINKTLIHAADLLSAAIVYNKREHNVVIDAANLILKNSKNVTYSQLSLAKQILNQTPETDITTRFKEVGSSSLSVTLDPQPFHEKIKETKSILRSYPYNAIPYVELARYYSILGQERKAVQSMKLALHLAPNNRFILRSATRLFAHYSTDQNDYLEYIHRILRINPITSIDPWLTSAEISISTIRGRNSRLIIKGLELINSGNISPFNFTELASSIGTVEMLNGSHKKSRELFGKSLLHPNDNSLAQIEWASSKDKNLQIQQSSFEIKINFEALSLESFHKNEFNKALENAAKWFLDQPYSKRPIMFGSHLASAIIKDQEKAISFLNAGLISHPNDPQLINNLSYALAISNRPEEALQQLDKIKHVNSIDTVTKICINATKGLIFFRSGFADQGRYLYLEAIEQTKKINNQNLHRIALLNYAREELLYGSYYADALMEIISKIPENPKDIEISVIRNEVMDLYNSKKSS